MNPNFSKIYNQKIGVSGNDGNTLNTLDIMSTNGDSTFSNGSVQTPTNTSATGSIPSFASSPYGDLELTKYLYESGIQNIFNEYQKNIQTLQQEQSQQLQQAYVIREMSKKYLGEYASNVGIGDVSGNLLDIYSQYAQNTAQIQQNFAALELNLSKEYTAERMSAFNKILETEYQIDMAQLDEVANSASNYVFENFDRDIQGGLAYLESQKDTMRPQDYEVIRDAYYKANAQAAIDLLSSENPYFGFSDIENQTLKTQEDYLKEIQQWLEPEDYERAKEVIALKEYIAQNQGDIDWGSPLVGIDASMYSSDPNITSDSDVYQLEVDGLSTRYAVSSVSILEDQVALDNNISADVLNTRFEEQTGMDAAEISENQIVQYQGFYIFRNGNWYRMQNIGGRATSFDEFGMNEFQTWNKDNQGARAGGVEINFDYDDKGRDAVIFNGKTYIEDTKVGKWSDLINSRDEEERTLTRDLIKYLNETFYVSSGEGPGAGDIQPTQSDKEIGDYVPKGQVFFYQGQFYVYTEDGKKIRPLVLQTETE